MALVIAACFEGTMLICSLLRVLHKFLKIILLYNSSLCRYCVPEGKQVRCVKELLYQTYVQNSYLNLSGTNITYSLQHTNSKLGLCWCLRACG